MFSADRLRQIKDRFALVEAELAAGPAPKALAQLSRDHAELAPVVARIRDLSHAPADAATP